MAECVRGCGLQAVFTDGTCGDYACLKRAMVVLTRPLAVTERIAKALTLLDQVEACQSRAGQPFDEPAEQGPVRRCPVPTCGQIVVTP